MSYHSDRLCYVSRMRLALSEYERSISRADGLEDERDDVLALVKQIGIHCADLVEAITDERFPYDPTESTDVLQDGTNYCFNDAIDRRDERRSPESITAYTADMERGIRNA